MISDNQDNMYYIGKATLEYDTLTSTSYPPGKIYLNNGHYIQFDYNGYNQGFIMKVDTSGDIVWLNHMNKLDTSQSTLNQRGYSEFVGIDINEENDEIYVSGIGMAKTNSIPDSYAIFPDGTAFESPCFSCGNGNQNSSYMIAFNKNTGNMLWHNTPYTEGGNGIGDIEYKNDSLYAGLRWGGALHTNDSIYTHDGRPVMMGYSHLTLDLSGEITSVRNFGTIDGFLDYPYETQVDDANNIWFTGTFDNDINFGGDTSFYSSVKTMFLAHYGTPCPYFIDTTAVICHGDCFVLGDTSIYHSGDYQRILQASSGTDSIVDLHLTVLPQISSGIVQDTTVCMNAPLNLYAQSGYNNYTWQDGSTGPAFSITYTAMGTDTLTVTMGKNYTANGDTYYCENTDTIFVTVDDCNNIVQNKNLSLGVHPNPAKNKTELSFPYSEKAELKIFDTGGRKVFEKEIFGNSYTLNLNKLQPGIYHIKLLSKEYILSKKLVVE